VKLSALSVMVMFGDLAVPIFDQAMRAHFDPTADERVPRKQVGIHASPSTGVSA
jgi:hypothetical protein